MHDLCRMAAGQQLTDSSKRYAKEHNSKIGIGRVVKKPFTLSLLCIFRDTNLDEYVSFVFPTAPPNTHNCCLDL